VDGLSHRTRAWVFAFHDILACGLLKGPHYRLWRRGLQVLGHRVYTIAVNRNYDEIMLALRLLGNRQAKDLVLEEGQPSFIEWIQYTPMSPQAMPNSTLPSAPTARTPPFFWSSSCNVYFFLCGMEKLTPAYDRHAGVDGLKRLAPKAPFCTPLLSSILRFFDAGSAGGWDD